MHVCRAVFSGALGLALLIGEAEAQGRPDPAPPQELEYAFPDQSVWTTRLNERGEPDNPLLGLAAALFAEAGVPWHGHAYPAARMFSYLREGRSAFSMLVKSPALEECCLLSRERVASTDLRLYRRSGTPVIGDKAGLVGKRLITIRGYSYGDLLDFIREPANHISNQVAAGHEDAFAMMEAGRADYLLDYAGPADEVLGAQPVAGLDYDVFLRLDVFLVLIKSYPEAEVMMERLEAIASRLDRQAIIQGAPTRLPVTSPASGSRRP